MYAFVEQDLSWSKQEEGRGKSVREQDLYQGIMAPHKIGNRPPFVKRVHKSSKTYVLDSCLNIPFKIYFLKF